MSHNGFVGVFLCFNKAISLKVKRDFYMSTSVPLLYSCVTLRRAAEVMDTSLTALIENGISRSLS